MGSTALLTRKRGWGVATPVSHSFLTPLRPRAYNRSWTTRSGTTVRGERLGALCRCRFRCVILYAVYRWFFDVALHPVGHFVARY